MPNILRAAWLAMLLAGLAAAGPASADDEAENSRTPALEPREAGADFALQGEYAGELSTDEGPAKYGIQVIALGDGKFEAVAYAGGLPGAGWDQSQEPTRTAGSLEDGKAVFENEHARGTIEDGVLTVELSSGETIGSLKRVQRKSPTLGGKPPEGAVVLFDGTADNDFKDGRITQDGLLIQGATSRHMFGDCRLHLEFLLSYMPEAREQARSNSGCYLQGRYEVQILDSFGLRGEDNECGGIYGVKAPDVNMCLPPLSWQTYDVEFQAARYDDEGNKTDEARMTVKHNGTLIHDDVPVPSSTRAAPVQEGPDPGPLYLQDHGDPVRFRNIWLVEHE